MATVAFTFFDCVTDNLAKAKYVLNVDTIKAVLSNTAPNVSTNTGLSDITQISAGNGYVSGGFAIVISSVSSSGGTTKIIATDKIFSASGGSVGPYQYIVFYDDTTSGDPLIGYLNLGSAKTLPDGDDLSLDFSDTNGLFQIAKV